MADLEDDMGPRGGKRNAIITYEEIAAVKEGVVVLNTKMDAVVGEITKIGKVHDDHEVRIRALELALAASTASRGMIASTVSLILAVVSVGVAVLAYLKP